MERVAVESESLVILLLIYVIGKFDRFVSRVNAV